MDTFKGVSKKDIATILVNEKRESPIYKDMIEADKYISGDNTFIKDKRRQYFDKDQVSHDIKGVNNARIASSFLRMLVQQKQDYGFSKPFKVAVTKNEKEVSDNDEYVKLLKDYIKDNFIDVLYVMSGNAVNKGIAWGYMWGEDTLKIKEIESEYVYPFWKDDAHTELEYLVYNYTTYYYEGTTKKEVEYAILYDKEEINTFNVSNSYTLEETVPHGWGVVPFIWLKGTDDEIPLIKLIREQIDSYDTLLSRGTDGVIDDIDPVTVLKGISPQIDELREARELLKQSRMAVVEADGDASILQAKTDVTSNLSITEVLRKDVFRFGAGVDYEDARFAGSPNEMLIKTIYQNLDIYMNGLERLFNQTIQKFKLLFDKFQEMNKGASGAGYEIKATLERSMMINKSTMLDDVIKLQATGASQRTQDENNPYIRSVEEEEERRKKEQEEGTFNFPAPTETVEEEVENEDL